MADALKPPPLRPRLAEGEEDKEEKLTEDQLHARDVLIRNIAVTVGIAVYAGIVFLLRELPGGSLPYVSILGAVPSVAYWLAAICLTLYFLALTTRRTWITRLLVLLSVIALASAIGAFVRHERDPAAWTAEFERKFG